MSDAGPSQSRESRPLRGDAAAKARSGGADVASNDFNSLHLALNRAGRQIPSWSSQRPGLMAIRGCARGSRCARHRGSLHMTIHAVLIETLQALGAEVRWASCNISLTYSHVAAAIASGTPVFAYRGETLDDGNSRTGSSRDPPVRIVKSAART